MTRDRYLVICVLIVGVLLAALACKPEPQPGSVDVVGDSITVQALVAGTQAGPDDVVTHAGLGWTAADVAPWVDAQVDGGRPETLVIALGSNDAALRNGGWTWADVATWVDLVNAPHEDACVAVLLPAVGDGADPAYAAQIDEARHGIVTVLQHHRTGDGPTVVEDWADWTTTTPGVLADDGLHLAPGDGPHGIDPAAADTRLAATWSAAAACEGALQ